jgi:hypothetical protein
MGSKETYHPFGSLVFFYYCISLNNIFGMKNLFFDAIIFDLPVKRGLQVI